MEYKYVRMVKWQEECKAYSQMPRTLGYVYRWNDVWGEGQIMDQDNKTQKYFVIRDDIQKCYHNYKSLRVGSWVEFYATKEFDSTSGLFMAKNITGAFGIPVSECEDFLHRLKRKGNFPGRWKDEENPEYTYPRKIGEWWTYFNPKNHWMKFNWKGPKMEPSGPMKKMIKRRLKGSANVKS